MNTANTIAEIEGRAARAEAAALETQIQLVVTQSRLADLEAAAAKRKDVEATAAVRQMVFAGAIGSGDTFTQHEWKNKFLADAALIPLCIGKPYNQRKRAIK
jgi:predicted ATPase with chaperone activity